MVFQHLFVVKEKISFAVENFTDAGRIDLVIVAPKPLVPVLPNKGSVVTGLDVANVVDDGEEGVLVLTHG